MLPHRVELLLVLLAAWRPGAAVTPVDPVFTTSEAEYQLRDADAVLVVTTDADTPTAGLPPNSAAPCTPFSAPERTTARPQTSSTSTATRSSTA